MLGRHGQSMHPTAGTARLPNHVSLWGCPPEHSGCVSPREDARSPHATAALAQDRSRSRETVAGGLTFRLGRRPRDRVRLGRDATLTRGPGMRKLGAKEHDQGGVIDPTRSTTIEPAAP